VKTNEEFQEGGTANLPSAESQVANESPAYRAIPMGSQKTRILDLIITFSVNLKKPDSLRLWSTSYLPVWLV
jgi:hypothetical protein